MNLKLFLIVLLCFFFALYLFTSYFAIVKASTWGCISTGTLLIALFLVALILGVRY